MPALVAFGRRWQIASDDFVFPATIDVLFRVSWLIGGSIVYWKEEAKLSCTGGHFMRNYLWGNTIILLLILFSDITLVQSSMAGTIMDTAARRLLRPFLYLRCLLEISEIAWNVLGTIWVFTGSIMCNDAPETLLLIQCLVILNWVGILILIIFVALVFDPSGATNKSLDMDYDRFRDAVLHGDHQSHRIWERRCKFLCCSCCGGDEVHRHAFKDVGKIMAFVFDQDIDLVPTDIAAGLIVINLKAQAEACSLKSTGVGSNWSRTQLDDVLGNSSEQVMPVPPWNNPSLVSHYMKYALGSYGWPWFLMANPKSGLFRLWDTILCCGSCVRHPCSVEGDNFCYCHTSALQQTTGLEDSDLWYASFHNSVFQTPFFVAIDHSRQSVVIAVRGTMSLRDAITDLTAEAKVIEAPGIPEGCKAHYGMMMTARNILQKLNALRLLERAAREYPTYDLVLTGHSLGAGAATVLGFLLYSQYPRLKCYAYSPPGGLLSLEGAKLAESFTLSVVVGDDIVSRLSVPAFERFKLTLIGAIRDCPAPKYRIVVGGCWYMLVGGIPRGLQHPKTNESTAEDVGSDTILLRGGEGEQPNYHTYVSLAEVSQKMQRESVTRCPMFLPGKIMHVVEKPIFDSRPELWGQDGGGEGGGGRYEWHWGDRNDFGEIRVTPKMMIDHYPDNVAAALADIKASTSHLPQYSVI